MALDMKRMRRGFEENQRGGDIWTPPTGKTKVYVHPPCRPEDKWEPTAGTNYIALGVHYGLGKDNAMGVCLDPEHNPILKHPYIVKLLTAKKIKLTGKCTVCKAIETGELDGEAADDSRLNTRFLWGITPVMHKAGKTAEWQKLTPKPSVALVGMSVYNGLMDQFMENGDITNPEGAIFAIIGREGTKKNDTKYEVSIDPDTLKKPKVLPPPVQAILKKALAPDGDCDLFKIVVNMIKSPEELKAAMAGTKVATGSGRGKPAADDDGADWDTEESTEEATEESEETTEDAELEDGGEAAEESEEVEAEPEDDAELADATADDEATEDATDDQDTEEVAEEAAEESEEVAEESEEAEAEPEDDVTDEEAAEVAEDDGEVEAEPEEVEEVEEEPPPPPPKKPAPKPAPAPAKPVAKPAAPAAKPAAAPAKPAVKPAAPAAKPAAAPAKPAPKPAAPAAKPAVPAKPAAAPAKPAPKPAPAAAEDDDMGLDELDAELEAISAKKPAPKPAAPAAKPAAKPGVKPAVPAKK